MNVYELLSEAHDRVLPIEGGGFITTDGSPGQRGAQVGVYDAFGSEVTVLNWRESMDLGRIIESAAKTIPTPFARRSMMQFLETFEEMRFVYKGEAEWKDKWAVIDRDFRSCLIELFSSFGRSDFGLDHHDLVVFYRLAKRAAKVCRRLLRKSK